jgi:hypothetical protein
MDMEHYIRTLFYNGCREPICFSGAFPDLNPPESLLVKIVI